MSYFLRMLSVAMFVYLGVGDVVMSQPVVRVVYLHHSTGNCIWQGGLETYLDVYNKENGTGYQITKQIFPQKKPYGWHNYPFDYWNIWVNNAGEDFYQQEPTLEILTKQYDVIVWKHCFPVSNIKEDSNNPDVASNIKSLENYTLQYMALREKMRSYPNTKFLVWTNTALIIAWTNNEEAQRARKFVNWVKNVWDEPTDNIFIWDFFELETDGGVVMNPKYAQKEGKDAHPTVAFSKETAPKIAQRIVDVIEGRGDTASRTGAMR